MAVWTAEGNRIRVVKITKSSGAGGYCSIWYRWGIEEGGQPWLTKAGNMRTWSTPQAARKAMFKGIKAK